MIEHPFSELLRHPKIVVKDLAKGDVLLRRRGAPALRLSRADQHDNRAEGLAIAGRALRNLAAHAPNALGEALVDEFAWTESLPVAERDAFVAEFARTVLAAAELDNFAALSQILDEWKATAAIHADEQLARRLQRPLSTAGAAVPRPAG